MLHQQMTYFPETTFIRTTGEIEDSIYLHFNSVTKEAESLKSEPSTQNKAVVLKAYLKSVYLESVLMPSAFLLSEECVRVCVCVSGGVI